MLTTEIKQRINTCRDILVGKLPDPKSQVLQITNALIYKFMDDQDRLAETLGGKASFFVNGLAPYAWHKLFDAKLTNQDRADKYVEGLEKLSRATHLPVLFQEIFKEAYVPFRDGRVITMFITEINKFDYTHSEELGNAYEYLLSIMGSQGDAGQFRTPRHIIEFLVDVVDPQKGETIYDPAAGTAGFLIAAYNHILGANEKLTASERRTLATNISGVDISPDMAKMARVNLYLHGFTTPNILEGDTLTDEPLWGKKHDVILANPPFMSPKGGIEPHDKFSIKAKRSEVLFVDYIAEHLKLKGRAGIIVPEGVIFQSGTTYKQLRKMLVEDGYLHAVVSLPAGLFQPYSGVKTSMLILDRERAQETDEILFLKVEKDGYSLSTQRSKLCNDNGELPEWCPQHSDLPLALEVAKAWREGKKHEAPIASWVSRKAIAESGEYALSGQRYSTIGQRSNSFPLVSLGEICSINPSKREILSFPSDTLVSFVPMSDIGENRISFVAKETKRIADLGTSYTYFADGDVLLAKVTPCLENGKAGVARNLTNGVGFGSSEFYVLRPSDRVLPNYVYYCLRHEAFRNGAIQQMTGTGGLQRVPKGYVEQFQIPLPPQDVQQEIVAELDRYQKIIDGARQVVENYTPRFFVESDWPTMSMRELAVIVRGSSPRPKSDPRFYGGPVPRLMVSDITRDGMYTTPQIDTLTELGATMSRPMKKGDVIITVSGNPGLPTILATDACIHDGFVGLRDLQQDKVLPEFLYFNLLAQHDAHGAQSVGAVFRNLTTDQIGDFRVPVPLIETQQKVVSTLLAEQSLIEASREVMNRFEAKIQATIERLWKNKNDPMTLAPTPSPDEEAA